MRPGFSPNKQGARPWLEEQDVVIICGTPVYNGDTGSRDSRIRISRNGYAERAMWVTLLAPADQPGLQGEFHRWSYRLDEALISRIDASLSALGQVISETSNCDASDLVRGMRFWHNGRRVELIVRTPSDDRLSIEQMAAFHDSWELIDAAVPPRE